MADVRLFFGFLIFTLVFNMMLGLYVSNSEEITNLAIPEQRELTLTNFPGVLLDYGGLIFSFIGVTVSILPLWMNILFLAINLTLIVFIIDLFFPG